jgi:hypothetical protein
VVGEINLVEGGIDTQRRHRDAGRALARSLAVRYVRAVRGRAVWSIAGRALIRRHTQMLSADLRRLPGWATCSSASTTARRPVAVRAGR